MLFKILLFVILLAVVATLLSRAAQPPTSPVARPASAAPASRRQTLHKLIVRLALILLFFSVLVLGVHWGWYGHLLPQSQ